MHGRVVVIGGGISGLAAAHALGGALPDEVDVLVLEGSSVIGGKLRAGEVAGLACDLGAEALLNRRPEAVELARAAGLDEDLVHPVSTSAAVWTRDSLRPMPRTVLGVPTDLQALARSGIVSRAGMARARIEPWLVRTRFAAEVGESADSVSVGAFVDRRLGTEVTDRLVEPLLGGVYAGHARHLSLAAAAPQIARLVSPGGSLLRAAAADRAGTSSAGEVPVFAGIRGGVGRLPPAVADSARARIRTAATVRELHRLRDGRWNVVVGCTADAEAVQADAVIIAAPAAPTARLLAEVAPTAAMQLRRIEYASMAVVTLAYPSAVVGDRLAGSGFLVPPVDGRAVKAATFSSSKWKWLRELGDQESVTVVRASIGRHGEEQVLQRDDAELVELAGGDLEEAVGLRGPLVDARVTRWGGALPQYTVGHAGRVEQIRAAVAQVDRLEVCGAAYDGIGIAACVADGQRAATRVLAELRSGRE